MGWTQGWISAKVTVLAQNLLHKTSTDHNVSFSCPHLDAYCETTVAGMYGAARALSSPVWHRAGVPNPGMPGFKDEIEN